MYWNFASIYLISFVTAVIGTQLCNSINQKSSKIHNVQTQSLTYLDCLELSFDGSDKINSPLGSIRVTAWIRDDLDYALNISFSYIYWERAYVRLFKENKPETHICNLYVVENPIESFEDYCLNFNYYNSSVNYILEFKAEFGSDILFKRLIFRFPPIESFMSNKLQTKSIFTAVDVSSNYGLVLKIQPLSAIYNITYYKVEVVKEIDNRHVMVDVRMLTLSDDDPEILFQYITYNEEGYYFFKISVISDVCPEDSCIKSLSPKIYIRRKYPSLVIGIVGASFLIPCVLFLLHMWTRRNLTAENIGNQEKLFIIHNQTPESHCAIVKALEKSLKSITNVEIVHKITEASHIVYVCGTHIFEPDPTVHKTLVIEANKTVTNVDIFVIRFPYSTKDVPPLLKDCIRFELMQDFDKFIHIFNCEAAFEMNPHYQDLLQRVEAAQSHIEPKKIILNMPIIIVTEQRDDEVAEPMEMDVLL